MNWPPPMKYTPSIGQPLPWNLKYLDLPKKPKIPTTPSNLRGGEYYASRQTS